MERKAVLLDLAEYRADMLGEFWRELLCWLYADQGEADSGGHAHELRRNRFHDTAT